MEEYCNMYLGLVEKLLSSLGIKEPLNYLYEDNLEFVINYEIDNFGNFKWLRLTPCSIQIGKHFIKWERLDELIESLSKSKREKHSYDLYRDLTSKEIMRNVKKLGY